MLEFKIVHKNNRKYLTFDKNRLPAYVLEMISEVSVLNLVKIYNDVINYYDITEMISIKEYFVSSGASMLNIRLLMESLHTLSRSVQEYLIDENHIVIDENLVFTDSQFSKVYFVLCPNEQSDYHNDISRLIKYIFGNYFSCGSIKEIRIREEVLSFLKNTSYQYLQIMNVIDELENTKIFKTGEKQASSHFDIGSFLKDKFTKKSPYNSSTCEVGTAESGLCLTNIYDITKKIFIAKDELVINRINLSKDYHIRNKNIGRNHARIYLEDTNIYLFDMGSKNGTFLNGEQLNKRTPYPVGKGDIISFADEEFIVC
ncbi:MAG: FHA domain-containing protein [Clostridia bacterium]|nr:FHA domain-containing protein [Clostridia bacterium]